ncbi:T9SS type B sorting domain-containing protein [Hymenobacter jeollabukensis]|uniref:PKD domain-containing protein n=1 Tax=Hymenobacter jeollabukensis TaxID=2025313 RepID=A0A5R8WWD6_9BACT|nr:PKD domain-containing protein [Hymenobacter jeollabukensis]
MLCTFLVQPALAQREFYHWYFGNRGAFRLQPGGPPAGVSGSVMNTQEGCASVADKHGNLLLYTNGEAIWDRTNTLIPLSGLGGSGSATQGSLIVRQPGSQTRYYVFAVEAVEQWTSGPNVAGFRYGVVDMSLRNGLGGMAGPSGVRVPLPPNNHAAEQVLAVRQANGVDYWIVVHGGNTNAYFAFPLTAAGLGTVPVVSQVGAVRQEGGFTASGCAKASPDGTQLAAAFYRSHFELLDFDPATGQVSNARRLDAYVPPSLGQTAYGVEFSPDGTKLYLTGGYQSLLQGVYQLDLTNNFACVKVDPYTTGAPYTGLQLGPDGRIYTAVCTGPGIDVITEPDRPGAACGFRTRAVVLPTGYVVFGITNFPTPDFLAPRHVALQGATRVCTGEPAAFGCVASGAAVVSWDFGDGAVEPAGTTRTVHLYTRPGRYLVGVTVADTAGAVLRAYHPVWVRAAPVVDLGPGEQEACAERPLVLDARQPDSVAVRWSDGSMTPTLTVTTSGTYWVEVRTPGGCRAADTVRVTVRPCIVPNIITPDGDGLNDTFVLRGLEPGIWTLRVFNRWGRLVNQTTQYRNEWQAHGQPAGVYYYELLSPRTGQRLKGTVEVVR